MRKYILLIFLLVFAKNIFSQDLQSYIDEFDNIVKEIPTQIYNSDRCDYLINNLNTLNKNLEQVLINSEQIHPDDIKNLRWTKNHADPHWRKCSAVGRSLVSISSGGL